MIRIIASVTVTALFVVAAGYSFLIGQNTPGENAAITGVSGVLFLVVLGLLQPARD